MNPTISIIIPIYNVEKYIESCLESVVNQTFKSLEVIMVNDGSEDESVIIAEKYARENKNFRIFNKEHSGVGDTKNLAIEHIKGEYVLFLDSDDMLPQNACENLYNKALKHNADIVIGKSFWQENGKELRPVEYTKFWFEGDLNKNYRKMNKIVTGIPIVTSKLYKRNLIKENKIKFPNLIGEDVPFWLIAWHKAKSVYLCEHNVYLRTQRVDAQNKSITQQRNLEVVRDRLEIMEICDKYCDENSLYEVKDYLLYNLGYIFNISIEIKERSIMIEGLELLINYIDMKMIDKKKVKRYVGISYKTLKLICRNKNIEKMGIFGFEFKKRVKKILRIVYRAIVKY